MDVFPRAGVSRRPSRRAQCPLGCKSSRCHSRWPAGSRPARCARRDQARSVPLAVRLAPMPPLALHRALTRQLSPAAKWPRHPLPESAAPAHRFEEPAVCGRSRQNSLPMAPESLPCGSSCPSLLPQGIGEGVHLGLRRTVPFVFARRHIRLRGPCSKKEHRCQPTEFCCPMQTTPTSRNVHRSGWSSSRQIEADSSAHRFGGLMGRSRCRSTLAGQRPGGNAGKGPSPSDATSFAKISPSDT